MNGVGVRAVAEPVAFASDTVTLYLDAPGLSPDELARHGERLVEEFVANYTLGHYPLPDSVAERCAGAPELG